MEHMSGKMRTRTQSRKIQHRSCSVPGIEDHNTSWNGGMERDLLLQERPGENIRNSRSAFDHLDAKRHLRFTRIRTPMEAYSSGSLPSAPPCYIQPGSRDTTPQKWFPQRRLSTVWKISNGCQQHAIGQRRQCHQRSLWGSVIGTREPTWETRCTNNHHKTRPQNGITRRRSTQRGNSRDTGWIRRGPKSLAIPNYTRRLTHETHRCSAATTRTSSATTGTSKPPLLYGEADQTIQPRHCQLSEHGASKQDRWLTIGGGNRQTQGDRHHEHNNRGAYS